MLFFDHCGCNSGENDKKRWLPGAERGRRGMIELFEHNQSAYLSAISMLSETGKAAIIHPTGTGKSFIGFKLCEENPDKTVCWLSPSDYIFKTQLANLAKVSGGALPENIRFFTYAKLMKLGGEELKEIHPDYIILDEFHRCGAQEWGRGVDALLNACPNVPVLGLSATNIRYLDNQRDMADELFDGNIASEMTLGDAIVRGILAAPKYVLSVFSYQRQLEQYENRIRNTRNQAVRRSAEQYLEALRRTLEKAEGLNEIFNKHMTERTGKYIVFCANYAHMQEMIEKAPEWFGGVDPHPHIYTVYSDDPAAQQSFQQFQEDDDKAHLKLLYCIDTLNEGVHVDDVSGVILLRPTVSPIVYKQQIGRALAAGRRDHSVIFDIALNIENLYSIGAIEEEMQIATAYYRSLGMDDSVVNEHFQVVDEVRDCVALFDKLNDTLSASWDLMYEKAQAYYMENGDLDVPKRYVTADGFTLGTWVATQRLVHEGKSSGVLTDVQIKKLEKIGMRWESVRDLAWERSFSAAKVYYETHGDLLVPTGDSLYRGVKLGRWLAQLRNYRRSNIQRSYLTDERIRALDAIGMVWDVPDYLFEKNYALCLSYYRAHGDLNIPPRYVSEDGSRLGAWVQGIRAQAQGKAGRRAELNEEQKARLNALGFVWSSRRNTAWDSAYAAACEYRKRYGNLNVPVAYVTEDGVKLGRWIRHQRETLHTTLPEERRKKLDAIGMLWTLPDPWEQKFALVQKYYRAHGDLNIPSDYVDEGVWIARWLSEQVARMNGKATGRTRANIALTDAQTEKLKSLGVRENTSRNDLAWEEQYAAAKEFYAAHGHLQIPKNYVSASGKGVGRWLQTQRRYKKENRLSRQRIESLDEIGVEWL